MMRLQLCLSIGRYFCVIHFCVIHPIFKEIDEVTQSVIQNFAVTYSVILAVIYSVILFFQWRKVSYSWKMPHQKKSIEIPQVGGVSNTGEFHRLGWCFIDWATAVVGRGDTGQLSASQLQQCVAKSKKHWPNLQNSPVQRDLKRWPGAKFHFFEINLNGISGLSGAKIFFSRPSLRVTLYVCHTKTYSTPL